MVWLHVRNDAGLFPLWYLLISDLPGLNSRLLNQCKCLHQKLCKALLRLLYFFFCSPQTRMSGCDFAYLNIATTWWTLRIHLESLQCQSCSPHFKHKWSSRPPGKRQEAVSRVLWQPETQLEACKQCQTQGRFPSHKNSVSQPSAGQWNMSLALAGTNRKHWIHDIFV